MNTFTDLRHSVNNEHVLGNYYYLQIVFITCIIVYYRLLNNLLSSWFGGGDSSVVRAPDSWWKGRGFESLLERRKNFQYLFHPRVATVARKRLRSFCQKRRWQVTAKHAYTSRIWLCRKWHGAWLYGVHRTRRDGSSFLWHQPCQRCKYITSVDIQKRAIKSYSLV